MEDKLAKEKVKEMLEGKKITNVTFEPYISIELEGNTGINVVPEQVSSGGCTYLELAYKMKE